MVKLSEILTREEIEERKQVCELFRASWIEVEGTRYIIPKPIAKQERENDIQKTGN